MINKFGKILFFLMIPLIITCTALKILNVSMDKIKISSMRKIIIEFYTHRYTYLGIWKNLQQELRRNWILAMVTKTLYSRNQPLNALQLCNTASVYHSTQRHDILISCNDCSHKLQFEN